MYIRKKIFPWADYKKLNQGPACATRTWLQFVAVEELVAAMVLNPTEAMPFNDKYLRRAGSPLFAWKLVSPK